MNYRYLATKNILFADIMCYRRKLIFGDDNVLSQKISFGDNNVLSQNIDIWRRLVVIVGKNIHWHLIAGGLTKKLVLSQNILGDDFEIFYDKYLRCKSDFCCSATW